jgi:hypothetical protein
LGAALVNCGHAKNPRSHPGAGWRALTFSIQSLCAADAPVGYKDTPIIPGQSWRVHDPDRPHPKVVTSVSDLQPQRCGTIGCHRVI